MQDYWSRSVYSQQARGYVALAGWLDISPESVLVATQWFRCSFFSSR